MKTAFLFPGYGSQFVGMAKDVYDDSRIMQEYFEEAANCLNANFVKLCFASSDAEISQLNAAYPSLFLVSCAFASIIKDRGIIPDLVAGYNTGEYAALYTAQSITFPDGLYLLNKYATLYQQFLDEHACAVLQVNGVAKKDLQDACKAVSSREALVHIAAYESDTQMIVAGAEDAIMQIKELTCKQKGVKCTELGVGVGLHSDLMVPVTEQLKMYLEKVDFKTPSIACMNAQGSLLADGDQVKHNVLESMQSPMYLNRIIEALHDYELIIQVGPGDQLGALAKETYPDKIVLAVQSQADIDALEPYRPKTESDIIDAEKSDDDK